LPFKFLKYNRREKVYDALSQRMPASCAELNEIGHTLNAFYIVQEKEENFTKLQAIFYDFQNSGSSGNPASNGSKKKNNNNSKIEIPTIIDSKFFLILFYSKTHFQRLRRELVSSTSNPQQAESLSTSKETQPKKRKTPSFVTASSD